MSCWPWYRNRTRRLRWTGLKLAADRTEFERLYHQRRAAYQQAHLRVEAGRASADALVEEVIDWLDA